MDKPALTEARSADLPAAFEGGLVARGRECCSGGRMGGGSAAEDLGPGARKEGCSLPVVLDLGAGPTREAVSRPFRVGKMV